MIQTVRTIRLWLLSVCDDTELSTTYFSPWDDSTLSTTSPVRPRAEHQSATPRCRPLTGRVNADGTVSLWAITSTVSANGDQGADPNQLVFITDPLTNTDPTVALGETFTVLQTAGYGEVLRGVSFTPAVPTTKDSCKDGAWQELVRVDGSSFLNQGACVSYVNAGK